jgi:hypothetical protein
MLNKRDSVRRRKDVSTKQNGSHGSSYINGEIENGNSGAGIVNDNGKEGPRHRQQEDRKTRAKAKEKVAPVASMNAPLFNATALEEEKLLKELEEIDRLQQLKLEQLMIETQQHRRRVGKKLAGPTDTDAVSSPNGKPMNGMVGRPPPPRQSGVNGNAKKPSGASGAVSRDDTSLSSAQRHALKYKAAGPGAVLVNVRGPKNGVKASHQKKSEQSEKDGQPKSSAKAGCGGDNGTAALAPAPGQAKHLSSGAAGSAQATKQPLSLPADFPPDMHARDPSNGYLRQFRRKGHSESESGSDSGNSSGSGSGANSKENVHTNLVQDYDDTSTGGRSEGNLPSIPQPFDHISKVSGQNKTKRAGAAAGNAYISAKHDGRGGLESSSLPPLPGPRNGSKGGRAQGRGTNSAPSSRRGNGSARVGELPSPSPVKATHRHEAHAAGKRGHGDSRGMHTGGHTGGMHTGGYTGGMGREEARRANYTKKKIPLV